MSAEQSSRRKRRRGRNAEDEGNGEIVEDRSVTAPKGRATRGRRAQEQSTGDGNFITNTFYNTSAYFGGVKDELDKVVWPDRPELVRLTRTVLIVMALAAIFLGVISLFFTELFIFGINEDNPIIFAVFFGVVIAVYFGYTRFFSGRNSEPPAY